MAKISNKIFFIALLLATSVVANGMYGKNVSFAATTPDFAFANDLTLGNQGNDVSALQQFLIAGGYLKLAVPTGYFGPLTKTALGAWQTSVNIFPATGYFGTLSREKINAAPKKNYGVPIRLIIPKLNISASFQYTGLNPDGTMAVPSNIYDVGWFTDSVRPGEKGVAIITGHIAQIRGGIVTKPGVFSDLNTLRPGDKLSVQDDKGTFVDFIVREVRNYDPTADAADVFTSSDSAAHLNLITCEGTWNPARTSYTERLVVFTDAAQ